jgi:hypothetical protein
MLKMTLCALKICCVKLKRQGAVHGHFSNEHMILEMNVLT